MLKDEPRPASAPLSSSGSDRSVAAVAAIIGCVVLAILLLFGSGGDGPPNSGSGLVTVNATPVGTPSGADLAVTGGVQPRGDTPGRRLGERLVLTARSVDGRPGYAIEPASDALVLADARLRPGDIVFELDDRPLDPDRIRTLGDELSVLDRVEITFVRDGLVRSSTIDLTATADRP